MSAKRRRKLRGAVLAIVLTLVALAAIVLILARPARVVGVSETSLADSLQSEAEAALGNKATCLEAVSGRRSETAWRCSIPGAEKSTGETIEYNVLADEWGCWDAGPVSGEAPKLSGCIWLMDYVHIVG